MVYPPKTFKGVVETAMLPKKICLRVLFKSVECGMWRVESRHRCAMIIIAPQALHNFTFHFQSGLPTQADTYYQ